MSIELKDVVAITGQPGLFNVIKSDDNAILVESLDVRKKRQLVKGNMMLSKLLDISIYTDDDSEPLLNVLQSIREKYGKDLPVTKKSSKDELMSFLEESVPGYDKERVYASNVKKLISWYTILSANDIALEAPEEEEENDKEGEKTEKTEKTEKSEKKPKAEKKPKTEKKPKAEKKPKK